MSSVEFGGLLGPLCGLVTQLAVVGGLTLWAFRVAKRRGGVYRTLRWLPSAGLVCSFVGLVVTVFMLAAAFGDVASVSPAERSGALSADISGAMWSTALGMSLSGLAYLGSAVSSAVGTWGRDASTPAK